MPQIIIKHNNVIHFTMFYSSTFQPTCAYFDLFFLTETLLNQPKYHRPKSNTTLHLLSRFYISLFCNLIPIPFLYFYTFLCFSFLYSKQILTYFPVSISCISCHNAQADLATLRMPIKMKCKE